MRSALIAVGVLAGCYNPTIRAGTACESLCPGELQCIDHICRQPGDLGPEPDASANPFDAAIDGRTIDGPPGDQDADGIADSIDNCPTIANVDQHDEDADAIGDVCDPCPHIAGTAADQDGDGVGDACDPQPTIAKQHIKFFDSFTSQRPEWTSGTNVTLVGETMRMDGTAGDAYVRLAVPTGELRIDTGGMVATVAGTTPHQISIAFGFDSTGTKYHYGEFWDNGGANGDISIMKASGNSTYTGLASTPYPNPLPTGAWGMRIDESVSAQQMMLLAKLGGVQYSQLSASTSTAPSLVTSNTMTVYIQHVDFRFDYWIVIETLP